MPFGILEDYKMEVVPGTVGSTVLRGLKLSLTSEYRPSFAIKTTCLKSCGM